MDGKASSQPPRDHQRLALRAPAAARGWGFLAHRPRGARLTWAVALPCCQRLLPAALVAWETWARRQPCSCEQGLAGASSPRLRCGLAGPPALPALHACRNPDACLRTAAVALEPQGRRWGRSPQAALASVCLQQDWLLMAMGKHPAQGPSGEGRQLHPRAPRHLPRPKRAAKSLTHVWRLRVWTGAHGARRLSASPLQRWGQPGPRGPPPQPQGRPWPLKAPFSRCQSWGRPRCRQLKGQ